MSALVPIANGSEEIEAVCVIDTLRRAGTNVCVASVEDTKRVVMSRKVIIEADKLIDEVCNEEFDMIVLPGGIPGAERLRDCKTLTDMLQRQAAKNGIYAAICAAPAVALAHHGLLNDHMATCYPNAKFTDNLPVKTHLQQRVVVSNGRVITSCGPGTALEFALVLVGVLHGEKESERLQKEMLVVPQATL